MKNQIHQPTQTVQGNDSPQDPAVCGFSGLVAKIVLGEESSRPSSQRLQHMQVYFRDPPTSPGSQDLVGSIQHDGQYAEEGITKERERADSFPQQESGQGQGCCDQHRQAERAGLGDYRSGFRCSGFCLFDSLDAGLYDPVFAGTVAGQGKRQYIAYHRAPNQYAFFTFEGADVDEVVGSAVFRTDEAEALFVVPKHQDAF